MTGQTPLHAPDAARPRPTGAPAPLRYSIFVNGSRRGRKTIAFQRCQDGFIARTSASIQVDAGLLASFRYEHTGQECWQKGKISTFDYVTDAGSLTTRVSGRRQGENLVVDGPHGRGLTVVEATTPSFWNFEVLGFGCVINPQTGEPVRLETQRVAESRVKIGNRIIEGRGFAITSYFNGQVWFDENDRSLGFWFMKNGRRIDVLRVP